MNIEVEEFCPIGKVCEEIREGKIYRCKWYKELVGKHPQSEEIINERDCAVAWIPLLMTEMSQTNRGQTQAIESFRNETLKIGNRKTHDLLVSPEIFET